MPFCRSRCQARLEGPGPIKAQWLVMHTALLLHAVRGHKHMMERSPNKGTYTLLGGGGGGVGVPFG